MLPEGPWDRSWREVNQVESSIERAVAKRVRIRLQRAWQEDWKAPIWVACGWRGAGNGC